MQIGGLQKLTLIDYPGKLACTVFLTGCNFRCPFCYSGELVIPEKIEKQPKISTAEFFDFLKKRTKLLDGVVLCGGEPTVNKDLTAFIKTIRKLGYLIKLDTNGSNPEILKRLIKAKLLDYVAMDIKAPQEKYAEATGLPKYLNGKVLKNINLSINTLKKSGIDFEFRTTVVPEMLDKEDIFKIAKWIKPAPKYFLQNFRAEKTINSELEKERPYPNAYLLEIQKKISPFFDICRIR
jgi:pyruvate formate lyase activating enzyme